MNGQLRVFTAFSGYDSQCMALDRLGIDYDLVGWSEIEKNAIEAHNAVYPQWADRNYGDISKIDWMKVPDFDLFTYSFPCGLAGTKVKTDKGYKNIEDIACGDKVLTYKNRYCEVVRTMSRLCPSYYKINAIGCKLNLTAEHPLWVLRDGVEQWVKVKDLSKSDKLSYCIPQGNDTLNMSDEMLWLLGRYVADGFINKYSYNSVLFAICNKKESEFLSNIPLDIKDRLHKFQKKCIEYRIADKELQELCLEFGNGSLNKHIPEWLFSANQHQIECFLNGYFSGDGHVRYRSGSKLQMFTTVSKDLFLGIQLLMMKCYKKVCTLSIRHDTRKNTFNDTYNGQLTFSKSPYQEIINDRIFVKIQSIEKNDTEVQVYNLEVKDDNSYTCDNVNTHNCQDISSAGYQKGLTEGSGTRSSLLWECKKAIEAKKPKYLLMENVKALTSKKFKSYLDKWLEYLRELGYSNYTKVLNAKNYGIPQNRERVFVVSILGDEMFYFPEEMKLEIFLNDILEDNVDERYYLKKKTIENAKINPLQLKYGNKRVQSLVDSGKIAQDKIVFIDAYNQSVSDLCGTIRTTISTSNMMFITEPITCAMRGRNVENPSDRRPGIPTQQMIEMGGNIANCITTVQKDSLVIEPKGRIIAEPSIQAYRIRKLTERECFRLMGVSEENIDKIQSSNVSKARQYKLAGNSIVVNVLYHIFRKMFIDKYCDKSQLFLFN